MKNCKSSAAVWAFLVSFVFALAGCGGGGDSTPEANTNTNSSYAVSGKVADYTGTGISGVTVALSGSATISATTDSGGNYTFSGLANGSYTITPSKTTYTFTPTNKAVTVNSANVSAQDFTGSTASLIYQNNFDNEQTGTRPAGFTIFTNGTGDPDQTVTTEKASSGSKSYKVAGQSGWCANVYYNFDVQNYSQLEASVRVYAPLNNSGAMSFFNKNGGPWGWYLGPNFNNDGKVMWGGDSKLPWGPQSYDLGSKVDDWNDLKIVLDTITKDFSFYLNNRLSFSGRYNSATTKMEGTLFLKDGTTVASSFALPDAFAGITGIAFGDCNSDAPTYFDDLSIMGIKNSSTTYSISGRVADSGNTAISGVTITLATSGNSLVGTATTDSNGQYTFAVASSGGYVITPSKSGYTFTPTNKSVNVTANVTAQDFVGSIVVTDTTPPTVLSNTPASTATGIAANATISATFSEAMTASTITTSTFTLKDGSNNSVIGTVSYSGTTATFTSATNLAYSTTYTATITTGVKDLAGNAITSNYTWTFTTGSAPDTTRPGVSSTNPASGAANIAINGSISAVFSESMDASTITVTTFKVNNGAVTGTVTYSDSNKTATFTPSANLSYGSTYTVTITTGVKDLAANAMLSNYSWSFTTRAEPDTWKPTTTTGVPSSRIYHTAVWTGSKMIVWGGAASGGFSGYYHNTGSRYDPATDSWSSTSTTNAPSGRYSHTAVWTGTEMVVWGGQDSGSYFSDGGKYNPSTNSWTAVAATNAPSKRTYHTVIWTGSEMIIWGGWDGANELNSGGKYNPVTNTWSTTLLSGAPSGRSGHMAVWTGSEMIIWGMISGGGKYNPSTNIWAPLSTTNEPSPRRWAPAVWTGNEMIVWGGSDGTYNYYNTGARYNPATDTWSTVNTTGAPLARNWHKSAWTGNEMIVWGGWNGSSIYNTGGRYNPSNDTWSTTSTMNAPIARWAHTVVWTENEMIVWGGNYASYDQTNTGGRYTP